MAFKSRFYLFFIYFNISLAMIAETIQFFRFNPSSYSRELGCGHSLYILLNDFLFGYEYIHSDSIDSKIEEKKEWKNHLGLFFFWFFSELIPRDASSASSDFHLKYNLWLWSTRLVMSIMDGPTYVTYRIGVVVPNKIKISS